jgi:hypothetical protein
VETMQPTRARLRTIVMTVGAATVIIGGAVAGVLAAEAGKDGPRQQIAASRSSTSTTAATLDDAELARRYGSAVYRVDVDVCGLGSVGGTAFAVDPHHLVTNRHVVALGDGVVDLQSRSGDRLRATVVAATADPDVAVLEVKDALTEHLKFVDAAEVSEGEHIVVLGYPAPEGDFAVTPGVINSFQVRSGERQALRTDAAIDHGNSGGPAITREGKVAGVITQFAQDTSQLVGLAFTKAAVNPTVSAGRQGRGSNDTMSCSELDAYVNQIVTEYEIGPGYLPSTATTAPAYRTSPPTTAYRAPTTTRPACPTGKPTVITDSVESEQVQEATEYSEAYWRVTVRGRIVNKASASVALSTVDVTVRSDVTEHLSGYPSPSMLRPGQTASWEASSSYVRGDVEPQASDARLTGWQWEGYEFYDCGTA